MLTQQAAETQRKPRWLGNSLRWLTGYGTSATCSEIFYVVLGWAAAQITTPGKVGLVMLATAVPQAVFLLVGGVLVDRVGPKVLVVVADLVRILLMVVAALAAVHGLTVEALVVIAVLFGVADGFFLPAAGSMPPFLAPAEAQTRIQAMKSVAFRAAAFVGAPLASIVIAKRSVADTFWVAAALFAVSVVTMLATRLPLWERPARRETAASVWGAWARAGWSDLVDGLRRTLRDPLGRALLLAVAVMQLSFTGPIITGLPLLATAQGWGAGGVGWTVGAFGVGGIVSALLLSLVKKPARPGLLIVLGSALIAVALGAIALSASALGGVPAYRICVAAGFVSGVGASLFTPLITAGLISATPREEVGKVMALLEMATFTTMPVSLAGAGLLAGWGTPATPFALAAGLTLVLAVGLFCYRPVRAMAG